MYKIHNWRNNQSPAINETNLGEMELGIASGCTYMATCNDAASATEKNLTISDFETSVLTASPGVPFVLYVLFARGSTSATMTIKVNSGTARNVLYRNSTSGINTLTINENDVVAFVYSSGSYYLLGAISSPISLIDVAHGGTGRATLTSNAMLAGNGTGAVKMITTASGALYATSANGAAQFGVLPLAQGGTGGTNALTARQSLGIRTGTAAPTSSTTGDIYFQYAP